MRTKIVLLISLLGVTEAVSASEVFPEIYPDTHTLKNPLMYIFVATVDELIPNQDKLLGAEDMTGVLNVTEVVRGNNLEVGAISARWNRIEKPIRVSRSQPPQSPRSLKIGDKVIVFSWLDDNGVAVVNYFYEFTDQNRRKIRTHMAKPERAPKFQLLLFLLMLIFPIIGIVALKLSFSPKIEQATARYLLLYSIVAPILTLVTYLIYESGISTYSNIRVDLLIIWPIVGASFILWLIPIYLKKRTNSNKNI